MTGCIVSSSREGRGGESNFYLGFRGFSLGRVTKGCTSHSFISLGESPSAWLVAIEDEALEIYEALLQATADYLSECFSEPVSTRKAAILTGHLARVFAWRSARANSQIRLALQLEPNATMLGTNLNFVLPRTTREALDLVASADYGAHLETILFSELSRNEVDIVNKFPETPTAQPAQVRSLKDKLLSNAARTLAPITRSQSAALIDPRLGFVREGLVNLRLGQLPIIPIDCEPVLKRNLATLVQYYAAEARPLAKSTPLAREFLRLVPSGLIEGRQTLEAHYEKMGWPSHPRVIFTSTRFAFDDVFKHYVSRRVDESQYWVGQHGNNYFTSIETSICPELETADKFLSWGYQSGRVEPVGQLFRSRISSHFSNRGVALILQGDLPLRTYCDWHYREAQYLEAIEQLVRLLSNSKITTEICLAPGTSADLENSIRTRLANFEGVSMSSAPLKATLKSGMMPVFTYDSTGMLELATKRRPFLAFLPESLDHISPLFSGQYEALRSEGFIAMDPSSALHLILTNLRGFKSSCVNKAFPTFTDGIAYPTKARLVFDLPNALRKVK